MVCWLVEFYGISTFVSYLTPNPFPVNNQLYFKQFSLSWVYSFSKIFLFQTIQVIQTVLIQLIQFSESTDFVYTVNVTTFIYITIQFSLSTVSVSKTVQFQTIQLSISSQFKCKYSSWKTFLFQAIYLSQAVLIQLIQFRISTHFVFTQLNVKIVLC